MVRFSRFHSRRSECSLFVDAMKTRNVRINEHGRVVLSSTDPEIPLAFSHGNMKFFCEVLYPQSRSHRLPSSVCRISARCFPDSDPTSFTLSGLCNQFHNSTHRHDINLTFSDPCHSFTCALSAFIVPHVFYVPPICLFGCIKLCENNL